LDEKQMNNEFKKIESSDYTRYVLENAGSGGTSSGSIASMDTPLGKDQIVVQSRMGQPTAPKPRNFVAKNAKTGGAGAHKDKKKAEKQGDVKHKNKDMDMGEGFPKDPNAPKLVQDRKTGKWYDPNKEFEKKMTSPEVMAQMKRMAQKEGVAEGVAETLPMHDAVKVLRQYGADNFKTTSNELHFYKQGRPFSVDLIWGNEGERSVNLSQLNSATRRLKGQGVAEGSEGFSIEDMVMDQYRNGNEVWEIASNMGMSEDEVQDIINDGEQGVAEGVAETLPMHDAVKVLRQYGADHFKTTSNELRFYKQGRPFSVDLIWGNEGERSVNLSQLNSATRGLKGQGVAEGKKPEHNLGTGWMLDKDKQLGQKVAQNKAKARQEKDTLQKYADKKVGEEKKKGADGKACWKGYRYAGTENGKDKCIPVGEDIENIMGALIESIIKK
jgi:hypothetical protein